MIFGLCFVACLPAQLSSTTWTARASVEALPQPPCLVGGDADARESELRDAALQAMEVFTHERSAFGRGRETHSRTHMSVAAL